jgi:hypothetical protein
VQPTSDSEGAVAPKTKNTRENGEEFFKMKMGLRFSMAALAGLVLMAVPAAAQQCKVEAVTATSREYISRSLGAFPGSWAAWRKEVKARHGNGWQAWRRAEERKIQCKQAKNAQGRKRWTCTRTARPCRPGVSGGTNPGDDSNYIYQPIDTVLKRGMNGEQVKTLQYLLKQAGYDVDIDGDFGRTTEKALIAFQRKSRIDVDGRAGPKTVEALTS